MSRGSSNIEVTEYFTKVTLQIWTTTDLVWKCGKQNVRAADASMFQDGRRVTHTAIIVENSIRRATQAAAAAKQQRNRDIL